jgi:peptidoglycan/xylan/chitin deacetylase (PgdA/CDA1 family)
MNNIFLAPFGGSTLIPFETLRTSLFGYDEDGAIYLVSPEYCFADTDMTTPAGEDGAVAAVLDLSGNDRHLTQPTVDNRPILKRDSAGRWYLAFNGTTHYLYREEAWFYAAGSSFFAIAINGTATAGARIISEGSSSSTNQRYSPAMSSGSGSASRSTVFTRANNNTVLVAQEANGPLAFVQENLVLLVKDTGTQITRSADRISGAAINYTRSTSLTLNRFSIGAYLAATPSLFFTGRFYGLVGVAYTPTEDQELLAERFVNQLIGKSVVLQNDAWPDKMLASYMQRNMSQAKWFDTTEVATIAERDALSPTMGQWCYVADVAGSSKEYVYDANVSHWVDAGIDAKSALYSGSSGRMCRAELLARLQSGQHLHDVYGPPGANRNVCDFVFLLLTSTNTVNRPVAFGDLLRYDRDGTAVSASSGSNGWPAYTIGANKGVITVSNSDPRRLGNVTHFLPYDTGLIGAMPTLILKNATGNTTTFGSVNLSSNNFAGELPDLDLESSTVIRLRNSRLIGDSPAIIPTKNTVTQLSIFDQRISGFERFVSDVYSKRLLFPSGTTDLNLGMFSSVDNQPTKELEPKGKSPLKAFADGDVGTAKHKLYELQKDPYTQGFHTWAPISYALDLTDERTLIITFDDTFAEHATATKDLFDAKGVRCVHYVQTDFVDTSGRLTTAQVQSLAAAGFDMQCHNQTGANFTSLTDAEIRAEIEAVNAWFVAAGLPEPNHHAYQNGGVNGQAVIRDLGRLTGRKIGNDGYINKYLHRALEMPSARSLDGASTPGSHVATLGTLDSGVMVFYGHGVYVDDPSESTYSSPTKLSVLSDIIDHCQSNGIAIKTLTEVFDDRCWWGID